MRECSLSTLGKMSKESLNFSTFRKDFPLRLIGFLKEDINIISKTAGKKGRKETGIGVVSNHMITSSFSENSHIPSQENNFPISRE